MPYTPPPDREVGADEVYALVPSRYGVSIVAVGDLAGRLDSGEMLEEAVSNAGIDSVSRTDGLHLAAQVERVRQLNLTGDSTAFWSYFD